MSDPVTVDCWSRLRRHTAARIALGRAGGSVPTRELLAFNADHAAARDAVRAPFAAAQIAAALRPLGSEVFLLESAASDRPTYLQRSDLGRQLSAASSAELLAWLSRNDGYSCDLVILVCDGLSAQAAEAQAPLVLAALWPRLLEAGWKLAPLCIGRYGRVALMDEVGAALRARFALILLGERPGLGTPDSLGAYLEAAPQPGRTDAERNCVSNIRPSGLAPVLAAEKIFALLTAARGCGFSGVRLKEGEDSISALGSAEQPDAPQQLKSHRNMPS